MELKKLTETTFSDVKFDLYKKEEKTGTISLITCKVNLPSPAVPSKVIETAAPPPPPPPQMAPPPPPPQVAQPPPPLPVAPPPPGPPMPSKQEQSKDATTSQNPNPPPRAMKRERSMLDEIKEFQEKKKLKSVDSSNERPVP